MNRDLLAKIKAATDSDVRAHTQVGGGCIANACAVELASGDTVFVKSAPGSQSMFLQEANGLRELASAKAISVPKVIHAEADFLILEHIASGRPRGTFMADFGRAFAQLHRHTAEHFGFYEDNFIGSTPQINDWSQQQSSNWCEFYFEHRILYQYRLAERNGHSTPALAQGIADLEAKIHALLAGSEEPPTLLHGDLWGGNYMVSKDGDACLIDPAVYYGHREADLAMTRLFGGFERAFYDAYNEAFPLPPGASRRQDVYKLYHILNHLNLFGQGYFGQSMSLLRNCIA